MLHLALDNLLERIPLGGTIRAIVARYWGTLAEMIVKKSLIPLCAHWKKALSLFVYVYQLSGKFSVYCLYRLNSFVSIRLRAIRSKMLTFLSSIINNISLANSLR